MEWTIFFLKLHVFKSSLRPAWSSSSWPRDREWHAPPTVSQVPEIMVLSRALRPHAAPCMAWSLMCLGALGWVAGLGACDCMGGLPWWDLSWGLSWLHPVSELRFGAPGQNRSSLWCWFLLSYHIRIHVMSTFCLISFISLSLCEYFIIVLFEKLRRLNWCSNVCNFF